MTITRTLLVGVLIASEPVLSQTVLPETPVREVVDDYFGTKVSDPYRWLEKTKDPEVIGWIKAQNDYARAVFARIPERDRLLDRIKALDNAGSVISAMKVAGGRFFYLKIDLGSNANKLYVRDTITASERLLVDPDRLATEAPGQRFSIDYFEPSIDGTHVAYGVSPGGSEDSALHVLETATGRVLRDVINRARLAKPTWLPDCSFFYTRTPKLPPDAPPTARFQKARTYRHVLGSDPDTETAVWGYGVSPDVRFEESDIPMLYYSAGAPHYLVGLIVHGARYELDIYTSAFQGDVAKLSWKKAVDQSDAVTGYATHGDSLFLLSHRDPTLSKVLRISLATPDLAHTTVVVPPGDKVVVKKIMAASDALYVQDLAGGLGRIRRVPYDSATVQPVTLPFDGGAPLSVTGAVAPGVWLELTSWTRPSLWYAFDPPSGTLKATHLVAPSSVDTSQLESTEVQVKSADGTMVPLSIVHQRGLRRDGSHPTWLQAFGAYGVSLDPMFRPTLLALLERGGIFAVAHVRGGGEYGKAWHLAGHIQTKQRSVDDLLASAEYLIDHKYTSSARLALECTSAGGITCGGAVTQRPDLFGVALILVGWSNLLRFETMPNGPANVPEFGTVKDPAMFPALYAMDAYHHVKPKTPYPAVLLTAGGNDARLEIWHAAKITARLQASTSSGKPVLLRVDYDAGHASSVWSGFGSTRTQRNEELADELAFMFWQMGLLEPRSTSSSSR
jgi:prolyl oligopeptidase